jgi:hypothetical protein
MTHHPPLLLPKLYLKPYLNPQLHPSSRISTDHQCPLRNPISRKGATALIKDSLQITVQDILQFSFYYKGCLIDYC